MTSAERIAELEAKVEDLEHQIAELTTFPGDLPECLSPVETSIFGALYQARGRMLSRGQILASYGWGEGRDAKCDSIIAAHMCHIRKKVSPLGITIRTVWGRGYIIDKEAANAS